MPLVIGQDEKPATTPLDAMMEAAVEARRASDADAGAGAPLLPPPAEHLEEAATPQPEPEPLMLASERSRATGLDRGSAASDATGEDRNPNPPVTPEECPPLPGTADASGVAASPAPPAPLSYRDRTRSDLSALRDNTDLSANDSMGGKSGNGREANAAAQQHAAVGTRVVLRGLKTYAKFNGQEAVVHSVEDDNIKAVVVIKDLNMAIRVRRKHYKVVTTKSPKSARGRKQSVAVDAPQPPGDRLDVNDLHPPVPLNTPTEPGPPSGQPAAPPVRPLQRPAAVTVEVPAGASAGGDDATPTSQRAPQASGTNSPRHLSPTASKNRVALQHTVGSLLSLDYEVSARTLSHDDGPAVPEPPVDDVPAAPTVGTAAKPAPPVSTQIIDGNEPRQPAATTAGNGDADTVAELAAKVEQYRTELEDMRRLLDEEVRGREAREQEARAREERAAREAAEQERKTAAAREDELRRERERAVAELEDKHRQEKERVAGEAAARERATAAAREDEMRKAAQEAAAQEAEAKLLEVVEQEMQQRDRDAREKEEMLRAQQRAYHMAQRADVANAEEAGRRAYADDEAGARRALAGTEAEERRRCITLRDLAQELPQRGTLPSRRRQGHTTHEVPAAGAVQLWIDLPRSPLPCNMPTPMPSAPPSAPVSVAVSEVLRVDSVDPANMRPPLSIELLITFGASTGLPNVVRRVSVPCGGASATCLGRVLRLLALPSPRNLPEYLWVATGDPDAAAPAAPAVATSAQPPPPAIAVGPHSDVTATATPAAAALSSVFVSSPPPPVVLGLSGGGGSAGATPAAPAASAGAGAVEGVGGATPQLRDLGVTTSGAPDAPAVDRSHASTPRLPASVSAPTPTVVSDLVAALTAPAPRGDAVARAVRRVTSGQQWAGVASTFAEEHAAWHQGDIVRALRAGLTAPELTVCDELLRGRGVDTLCAPPRTAAHAVYTALLPAAASPADADAVAPSFAALRGSRDWKRLQRVFLAGYADVCDGDVAVALLQLPVGCVAAVDEVLREKGFLHGLSLATHAVVHALYKALRTTEAAARTENTCAAVKAITSREHWGQVSQAFARVYPAYHGGRLAAAVVDEVGMPGLLDVDAALGSVGVHAGLVARAVAAGVHRGLSRLDSNAREVAAALQWATNEGLWRLTVQVFASMYPEFYTGDIVSALRHELAVVDLMNCNSVLNAHGIHVAALGIAHAYDTAEGLYAAMKGFGTDEDAIYALLMGVKDAPSWQHTRQAFAAEYPDFHHGNLLAALKDELSREELARCGAILRDAGVEFDTPTLAKGIADGLHDAMRGLGTDEAGVYRQLLMVRDRANWCGVRRAFATRHGDFRGGDLVAALRDELTAAGLEKCAGVLRQKGVDMVPTPDARGIADGLHTAMKGLGTDEKRIYQNLEAVANQDMWDAVRHAFATGYPGFFKGDVVAALRDEMSSAELEKCTGILRARGVDMAQPPTPHAIADGLHAAMKGFGTDEEGVYRGLKAVDSEDAWVAVQRAFALRYSEFNKGDLLASLRDELSEEELGKCAAILEENGVDMAPRPTPEAIASGLHRAMTGLGTDEAGVYAHVEAIEDTDTWTAVCRAFATAHGDFHGGDVVAALRDELNSVELAKCRAILGARGIDLVPVTPHTIAEALYKAMRGLGTDERGVYEQLAVVRSEAEWGAIREAFAEAYRATFHGGDLVAALRGELNETEFAKCKGILSRGGVVLAPPSTATPPEIADALHAAMKGFGTDEDAVYAQMAAVQNPATWHGVLNAFTARHSGFHNGDLLAALRDELSSKELAKCGAILKEKGVDMIAVEATAQTIADTLYTAMKGFGTDEDAVYKQMEAVQGQAMWNAVRHEFATKHSGFHKGDLIAALRDELSSKELAKCVGILKERGVDMVTVVATPQGIADALHTAMKGFGTDEDAVYKQMEAVQGQAMWDAVLKAFAARHSGFHKGDLIGALRDELSSKEFTKCSGILKERGVDMVVVVVTPQGIADALHTAMKGFGTDEKGIYQQLEAVEKQAMWDAVLKAFAARHSGFHRGDLIAALSEELSSKEFARCAGILKGKGIGMMLIPSPQAIADGLYTAMKGLGTDERGVYQQLEAVGSEEVWAAVRRTFASRHGDFHDGDVVAALRDELSTSELERCRGILRGKGVGVEASSAAAIADALARAVFSTPSDARTVLHHLRSISNEPAWRDVVREFSVRNAHRANGEGDLLQALHTCLLPAEWQECKGVLAGIGVHTMSDGHSVAAGLYKAMHGSTAQASQMYRLLASVRDADDWGRICQSFERGYPGFHGGDLPTAMRRELMSEELATCEAVLRSNGIHLGQQQQQQQQSRGRDSAAAADSDPARLAEGLRDALQRPQDDEDAVYRVLRHVTTQASWHAVESAFEQRFPSYYGGDVQAAMREELGAQEFTTVERYLLQHGVVLSRSTGGSSVGRHAAHANTQNSNALLPHNPFDTPHHTCGSVEAASGATPTTVVPQDGDHSGYNVGRYFMQERRGSRMSAVNNKSDAGSRVGEHAPLHMQDLGGGGAATTPGGVHPATPPSVPVGGAAGGVLWHAVDPAAATAAEILGIDGYYVLHTEEWNRRPVWVDANGGPQCIFVNNSGKWTVSTKREHMARSTGWVKAKRAGHRTQRPHEVPEWRSNDGQTWADDPHVRVTGCYKMMLYDEAASEWTAVTRGAQLAHGARLWVGEGGREFLDFAAGFAEQRRAERVWDAQPQPGNATPHAPATPNPTPAPAPLPFPHATSPHLSYHALRGAGDAGNGNVGGGYSMANPPAPDTPHNLGTPRTGRTSQRTAGGYRATPLKSPPPPLHSTYEFRTISPTRPPPRPPRYQASEVAPPAVPVAAMAPRSVGVFTAAAAPSSAAVASSTNMSAGAVGVVTHVEPSDASLSQPVSHAGLSQAQTLSQGRAAGRVTPQPPPSPASAASNASLPSSRRSQGFL